MIKRDKYLNELFNKKNNGLVKVITGLRRSGKSYLLFNIYYDYLISSGIEKQNIITFSFDNREDINLLDKYRKGEDIYVKELESKRIKVNANKFLDFIKEKTTHNDYYYIFLDEIQELDDFVNVLNGLLSHNNFDIYVTGSNSNLLSKDILTKFRGRGDNIYIQPLSFKEFYNYVNLPFNVAYREYSYFGGMPYLVNLNNDHDKQKYLINLFKETYIKDIVDRNNINDIEKLEKLLSILSSGIGSYTSTTNIENVFKSVEHKTYHHETIKNHLEYLKDSFLINEAKRYDIKGLAYIGSSYKYYFTDIGLRNALINFRQDEPTHIMENIVYNTLIYLGYNVDIGIVEISEKNENNNYVRKQLETDFICNTIKGKIYIQSAYSLPDKPKLDQEKKSLINIKDNFRKIIITKDDIKSYVTEEGIEIISLEDFLLNGLE